MLSKDSPAPILQAISALCMGARRPGKAYSLYAQYYDVPQSKNSVENVMQYSDDLVGTYYYAHMSVTVYEGMGFKTVLI